MKISMLSSLSGRRVAFTMAEILLSLTIIGVVAAITLPSLTGNINERTWNTQRKALFSRLSQAISLVDNIKGYGRIDKDVIIDPWYAAGSYTSYDFGDSTEAFLTGGLSKVMKLNNVCDSGHIQDCGMPDTIVDLSGSKVQIASMSSLTDFNEAFAGGGCGALFELNGKNAAFETANGESVLAFYNPSCLNYETSFAKKENSGYVMPTQVMCLSLLYDLNGKKGPNTVGKDVGFMSAFYPNDTILVSPQPATKNASNSVSYASASKTCTAQSDDLRVPTKEELMSIGLNNKFMGSNFVESTYLTSSLTISPISSGYSTYSAGSLFVFETRSTAYALMLTSKSYSGALRCVKR